tara:strand:- start:51504 stop:52067 length:564 start_codon:yes stop_codon:yes gene_type:complete
MSIKNYLPVARKGDGVFEAIWANLLNPEKNKLSAKHEEIKERWTTVFKLRSNYLTRQQVRNYLIENFEISESQAYKDVANSEHFYGNAMRADQEGYRVLLTEWAEKFFQRTLKEGDLKMQGKALELIAKFAGINDDNEGQFNPEKFENVQVEITLSPAIEEALIKQLNKGVVDFNQVEAEDADFVEV